MRNSSALTAAALLAAAALPSLAAAQATPDAALIAEGQRLFFEETFGGNGRTCGTCHPRDNNFTIDPEFIARLPPNDPLFIATPSLGNLLTALEVNTLLRRHGLICENVDGFDRPCVLRSVPHTLGMRTSLVPPEEGFPLVHATGWSGDGSPRDGSLRSFAIGAVIQHFPKTLARVEGLDFRMPTERELDAMEAFQLSLGRQEEVNITPGTPGELMFTDPFVEVGKSLFHVTPSLNGTRSCAFCHANAGANTADGGNASFATGVARTPQAPACIVGFKAAADGGFGVEPTELGARTDLCVNGPITGPRAAISFHGDQLFNTPPLIEAADTPPFFHNNTADTIEDAVEFYTTHAFGSSPAGGGNPFVLDDLQINAIGGLLRALNALENGRSANAHLDDALAQADPERAAESVDLAVVETEDAIEVLTGGPAVLFGATAAVARLREARALGLQALANGLTPDLIHGAIHALLLARAEMLEE